MSGMHLRLFIFSSNYLSIYIIIWTRMQSCQFSAVCLCRRGGDDTRHAAPIGITIHHRDAYQCPTLCKLTRDTSDSSLQFPPLNTRRKKKTSSSNKGGKLNETNLTRAEYIHFNLRPSWSVYKLLSRSRETLVGGIYVCVFLFTSFKYSLI